MKTPNEIIDQLAGRCNLTRNELIQLAKARRAQAPTEEVIEAGAWAITIYHHIHTGGHWTVSANLAGIPWHYGSTVSGRALWCCRNPGRVPIEA